MYVSSAKSWALRSIQPLRHKLFAHAEEVRDLRRVGGVFAVQLGHLDVFLHRLGQIRDVHPGKEGHRCGQAIHTCPEPRKQFIDRCGIVQRLTGFSSHRFLSLLPQSYAFLRDK